MKVLGFHKQKIEDSLWFSFEGIFDARVSLERAIGPLLQALEKYADGWMPDVVEGKRQRKYSRPSFWKSLEEYRDGNHTTVGLYRTQSPALDTSFSFRLPPRPPELDIMIRAKPLTFFKEEERCRKFIELVRAWASHYPTTYAWGHSSDDSELAGSPCFGRDPQTSIREGFNKLYEVFWLNVFGPQMVATVGRERMLSTPAHLVEELPNGSILVVLWPTVTDFTRDEARIAQARAHVHLRPDLDFDTVLRALCERNAQLTPVEPHFPPDLAPLLSRVMERIPSHARPRKIAEFNAWHPPEPTEWRPAQAALPSDVKDPARALEHYSDLAELLVALMHTKAPSVFNASPESLTDVDFQFWRDDFPTVFERERIDAQAVPAIGAYLGQVLVRHLGGRWLPRERLEEAQVLVGQRVWLPFVRAHRYMRSSQALLDFSLTQLYREAERYR